MSTTAEKRLRSPHQPVGRWIRPEKRLAIYLRDGFACLHCGRDLHGADVNAITLDHYKAKKDGGGNDSDNVFTACKICNSKRQATPVAKSKKKAIKRQLALDLAPYKKLAMAVMAGEIDSGDALNRS